MYKIINGEVIKMTDEEIQKQQEHNERESRKAEALERRRPLTDTEVAKMVIAEMINNIAVDDQTALRMKEYYPEWASGKDYTVGYKVQHKEKLYKVVTAHTSQADWTPDVAVTLYERIDEEHDGSEFDPIPYDGNMVLESGKYYTQSGVTYLCTRGSGIALHHALAELVGQYVELG